jgi:hypothetical protein
MQLMHAASAICRSQIEQCGEYSQAGGFGWIFLRQWNNLAYFHELVPYRSLMNLRHALSLLILSLPLAAVPAPAQTFKFSEQEAQDKAADKAEADARQGRIAADLATPCRADLKGKKIMVIIGEVQSNGFIAAQQQNYGPHFQAINSRLRSWDCARIRPRRFARRSPRRKSTHISATIPTRRWQRQINSARASC